MKNILRHSNFGFKNRIMRMALLRSEPRRLNRSFGGLRASLLLALTAGWIGAAQGWSQVNVGVTSSYSQNFNSLTGTTWTDNSTISGWYASRTAIVQGTGSSSTGAMYSFGSSGTPADRALGGLESNGTGAIAFGVQFNNNSGGVLTSINVAYVGEQWRQDPSTTPDVINFYYKVATTADSSVTSSATGWTAVSTLDFTNPKTGTVGAIDGNASANRTSVSSILTGISIPNGSYLFLKWVSSNVSGNDQGMSIDDLSVSWTTAVATAPAAPSITSINPGDGSLSVAFTAPSSDGGATISNYQYSTDNGGTFTAFSPARTTSPLSITGLVNSTTYSVQIKAVNSAGAGEASASIDGTPVAPAAPPELTSASLTGKVAVAFSEAISATGSPSSFALATGTLPAGLSLDSDTGVISGQPSAAGSFSVTVTASNSSGTSSPATIDFTIDKGDQSITVLAATATKFTTDVPYSLGVAATSGLAVSYASSEIGVATFSGGTVTLVGAGSTTLTASQAGDDNWNPATDVTQTLTVVPPPLATWEVGTQLNGGASPLAPNFSNNNLDVVGLTKGSGVGGVNTGGLWGGNNFTAADQAGAITAATFATFSLTPKLGFKFSISEISSYNIRRSGTGPATCIWQYQKGSGAFTDIGSAITNPTTTASGNTQPAISLSDIADLQNVPAGTTVTFRLSAWGGAAAGTFYINNITGNDLAVQGTVVEDTTVIPALTSFTPAFGASGSTVTISGSDLSIVTGVKFNGQSATFTYQSSDQTITATVPAGLRAGKISLIYGSPEAEVLSATNFEPLDGSGLATVVNGDGASPYVNTAIFAKGQSDNQTLAVTVSNPILNSAISTVRITLPSDFPLPSSPSFSLNGAGTVSVSGRALTVENAVVISGFPLTVTISGLSTPDTSVSTALDGNYGITVETAGAGGTLASVLVAPTAYVLVPIINLRGVDANGVPTQLGKKVAFEGVVTASGLGSDAGKTKAYIQDASAAVYIYSAAFTSAPTQGNVYSALGTLTQFRGGTQIDPGTSANLIDRGAGVLPEPTVLTLPISSTVGERYEGSLVKVVGLSRVASGTGWPAGVAIPMQNSAAATVDIFVQPGSNATAEPANYPVTVVGILGQYVSASPYTTGYQLQPRTQADLISSVVAPSGLSYANINGTEGTAISNVIPTVTGTVASYSIEPTLPAGLSIDPTTGVISGTPTATAASAIYTVRATNEGGNTSATLTVVVRSTYSSWLGAGTPSDAAFLDYVFGAVTPGTLDPSLKPTVAIVPPIAGSGVDTATLVLTYYVRQNTVGLTVTPKTSADLAAAPSVWTTVADDEPEGLPTIRSDGVTVQMRKAKVPVSGDRKFLRAEAVQE